jgi:hypothetical protein
MKCENCGGKYISHRKRDEQCPKNGESHNIWAINKDEPWKEVIPEWEVTRFKHHILSEALSNQ